MIYCTLLNPAIDLFFPISSFVSGSTVRDIPSRMFPAGKGINVASVIRLLGEEVCVAGIMPEHDLLRFGAYLDSKGIRCHLVPTPGDARVNVTIIEQKNEFGSHLNSLSPDFPRRAQDEFLRYVDETVASGDLWCFSGSIHGGFDDDLYAKLIKQCKDSGCGTYLDTRGKALKLGVRAKPLVLKPNSTELEELFGEQIQGVHHIALKGKKLLDKGISYVFISLGSDGVIALHENDCLLCVPPQVKEVDSVGCGDAFMAGLLVAGKRQFSFTEQCRLAVACGASKVMHEGPHSVVLDEVWQLMEDVKITAI